MKITPKNPPTVDPARTPTPQPRPAHAGKPRSTAPGESTFEARAATQGRFPDLDALWKQGRYPEILGRLEAMIAAWSSVPTASFSRADLALRIEDAFVVQHRLIALSHQLSGSPVEKRKVLELLQTVGGAQTELFRRAVVLADGATTDPVKPWTVYRNTFKQPGRHGEALAEKLFADKARAFIQKGGDLSEIQPVSAAFLKGVKSGQLCEWVVDAYDVARISRADGPVSPGHTLLAWGGDALSAGSLKVFKDDKGEIEHVALGTFSGHFRAELDSLSHMVRHLVAAGVPRERIFLQEGEAASPRTLEFLDRLAGLSGAEAQRRDTELIADAERWRPYADRTAFTPKEKIASPEVGARPSTDGAEIHESLFAMRKAVSDALADDMLLAAQGDGRIAGEFERALTVFHKAGSTVAVHQAIAQLRHLATLPETRIDGPTRELLQGVLSRWEKGPQGLKAVDAAMVFSPPPASDRRARIVATIDPKVDEAHLREMIAAGADVVRLNPAHATTSELRDAIRRARSAAASLGRTITAQIDLPGPKIRLGKFANPKNLERNDIFLNKGDKVTLTTADVLGTPALLPVEFPTLAKDVKVGQAIYLNDGTVGLRATRVEQDPATGVGTVEAEVVQGGKVWDRKGINLPDSEISSPAVTPEDVETLRELIDVLDLVAVSFVNGPEDVLRARAEMERLGRVLPIVAKIETPRAAQNLERIAAVSDALMVARGDLGVEVGFENVPRIERRINEIGNATGKPTMVATEVLHSMAKENRPTRGEVEGVYSAVFDQGADAIMLGKETSFPEDPANTVRAAAKIIEAAEMDLRAAPYETARGEVVDFDSFRPVP